MWPIGLYAIHHVYCERHHKDVRHGCDEERACALAGPVGLGDVDLLRLRRHQQRCDSGAAHTLFGRQSLARREEVPSACCGDLLRPGCLALGDFGDFEQVGPVEADLHFRRRDHHRHGIPLRHLDDHHRGDDAHGAEGDPRQLVGHGAQHVLRVAHCEPVARHRHARGVGQQLALCRRRDRAARHPRLLAHVRGAVSRATGGRRRI
mmetsp:Transcript_123282/g.356211  ORF Transcript_123282/g.356211 Transcript_123282/m.356211 type:complete len:206 (+) Transcript_123282:809-1426(+)